VGRLLSRRDPAPGRWLAIDLALGALVVVLACWPGPATRSGPDARASALSARALLHQVVREALPRATVAASRPLGPDACPGGVRYREFATVVLAPGAPGRVPSTAAGALAAALRRHHVQVRAVQHAGAAELSATGRAAHGSWRLYWHEAQGSVGVDIRAACGPA
jgi:hypothetical protein